MNQRGPLSVCKTGGDERCCTPPCSLRFGRPFHPEPQADVPSPGAFPPSPAVVMDKRRCVNSLSTRAPLGHNNCGARPIPLLESHFPRSREERQSTGGKGPGVPLSAETSCELLWPFTLRTVNGGVSSADGRNLPTGADRRGTRVFLLELILNALVLLEISIRQIQIEIHIDCEPWLSLENVHLSCREFWSLINRGGRRWEPGGRRGCVRAGSAQGRRRPAPVARALCRLLQGTCWQNGLNGLAETRVSKVKRYSGRTS